jgi:dTDP-4-dehydrorhamnose 3,5-epimerase
MIVTPTPLPGAVVVDMELRHDERGFFARSWCREEFLRHGLNSDLVQCNVSYNRVQNTLRGMHYQVAPHEETKLVRCTRGVMLDVIVDLRPDSPTFKQWHAIELSQDNHRALYIPGGLAHGFVTLTDNVEVFYQMSDFYHPECARGVRWNDPVFGIQWPVSHPILSDKDAAFPDFSL